VNVCVLSLVTTWHGVGGGMEVHGRLLTRGLVALGHDVTVVASRHPGGVVRETREGVTLHYLEATTFGSQRGRWAAECFARVAALHAQRPFDVVCCQQGIAPGRLLDLCRRGGPALVALLEGHEALMVLSELRQMMSHRRGYGRLPRYLLGLGYHYLTWELPLLRVCDRVIAVSDEIARSVRRWFGVPRERIDVVYNGVDTEVFTPDAGARVAARARLGARGPVVLFLSALTRQKGVHVLLRALPAVLAACPDVTVAVAGDGGYAAEARQLAQALGVSHAVTFLGRVEHGAAPSLMAACDVFVLPTLRQEGLPFAVLEAMACARPVIVSRIGGVPSVVGDGDNGLLVPPGEERALAAALTRVVSDLALAERLGARARATIERGYSAAAMVRGTAETFERAVRGRRSAPGLAPA